MPRALKVNVIVALAVTAASYWFFMFAKHDPTLSGIIPFSADPFDAVGSFAVLVSPLVSLLAVIRGFRPYRLGATPTQQVLLARTQLAVVFATLLMTVSDGVAMVRHPATWMGRAGATELLLLVAGMAALAIVAAWAIGRPVRAHTQAARTWRPAITAAVAFIVVLAVYPQHVRTAPLALLTIAVGAVLLFVPLAVLVSIFAPLAPETAVPRRSRHAWLPWAAILLLGVAIGVFALVGESRELDAQGRRGIPPARRVAVTFVFVGAGTVGVLAAYGSLRKPLGLFRM